MFLTRIKQVPARISTGTPNIKTDCFVVYLSPSGESAGLVAQTGQTASYQILPNSIIIPFDAGSNHRYKYTNITLIKL
jgi:hypothetical protein